MLIPKLHILTNFCHSNIKIFFFILTGIFLASLYLLSKSEDFQIVPIHSYSDTDMVNGFLVWNSKCHMLAKHPFDPSIIKLVEQEKYESCSNTPLLTSIIQNPNRTDTLMLNEKEIKHFKNISCCWSQIFRTTINRTNPQEDFDSLIRVSNCINFNNSIVLPKEVEILLVSCTNGEGTEIYKNVHSVLNFEKVSNRINISKDGNKKNQQRKLSVLMLGVDSVSRLNLLRTMPKTADYLHEKGWLIMEGYNKMDENTFPNLMAILTGQGQPLVDDNCKPTQPYGLDHCPIMWYNFRNAGYITAYAEDESYFSTFNFLKVGFVDPPTDYYLRPYFLSTEKLLKIRKRFATNYCTGPETVTERVANLAVDFATRFQSHPYFGLFWTNSVSHDTLNGPSTMDAQFLQRFKYLDNVGVTNDSMIIFLSDHGMRFGGIRKTFMGWYEERLPFLYIWVPEWFRKENPEVYQNLRVNQNRLTSPFDLYETLRDILIRAKGKAESSAACPKCGSLFKPVSKERGCEDAGISSHWCVCTSFQEGDSSVKSVVEGANRVIDHIENKIKDYKSKAGKRLCEKFQLQKIHRIQKVIDPVNPTSQTYLYIIEVAPGGAKFEATVHYFGSGNYSLSDNEISRINYYGTSAKCLDHGPKWFCHCVK